METETSTKCPATGRSASACADPINHGECWQGRRESADLDRRVERELRATDPTY